MATEQATLATNKANVATEQATLATNKANVATEQATLATNKANVATEQATLATNKANVATQEATNSATQAGIATQKAQAASDSERVVLQKAQEVSNNASLVATHTATVVRKSEEVAANTTVVEEKTVVVIEKASEVANNAIDIASRTVGISQAVSEALRNRRKNQYAASGFVHFGRHARTSPSASINEGMFSVSSSGWENKCGLGRNSGEIVGTSETNHAVFNVAGVPFNLIGVSDIASTPFLFKFPEAPDGTVTYDSATGVTVKHTNPDVAFSAETATNKVVTERVDMFGFEFFKEKVGEYLYPYGCIQSQLTTVDGVPTTVDNSRPITYFAVFEGDTSSRGRGWKLADLTFVQLATVLSNPEHNAWYNEKGELIQFRVRQRTVAGAGNGDWNNVNSQGIAILFKQDSLGTTQPSAQGILDDTPDWYTPNVSKGAYYGINHSTPIHTDNGIFKAGLGGNPVPALALDGECYFYVCGTVPRLNQGAYHPSYNPMGTKLWNRADGAGGSPWYSTLTAQPISRAKAFSQTTVANTVGAHQPTGAINQSSGRPDNRVYDAIYAEGLGGVIDYRLPAKDMGSNEEAAKVVLKVLNGTYRGLENVYKTKVFKIGRASTDFAGGAYRRFNAPTVLDINLVCSTHIGRTDSTPHADLTSPRAGFVYDAATRGIWKVVSFLKNDAGITRIYTSLASDGAPSGTYEDLYFILCVNAPLPTASGRELQNIPAVSGNFLQSDVIGSPAEILKVDALKDGWIGGWIPVIPDGLARDYPSTRKALNTPSQAYSTNSGTTWAYADSLPNGWNGERSSRLGVAYPSGALAIWHYRAFAKQTKSSVNKPVFNGNEGIGGVIEHSFFDARYGALFVESLVGKVCTDSTAGSYKFGIENLTSFVVDPLDFAIHTSLLPRHNPLRLVAPNNASPAAKALWYQTADNKQVSLNFAWNELVWGAGQASWGDDSTIRIRNGVGTFNNLNGAVCLYGTSALAIPYGYTKG
ncbi:hypothetical protein VCSRO188_3573 [Vibrio cholerae]|nr:hypothetical protein VCSRO188_3573 [Vibrio cholerae]